MSSMLKLQCVRFYNPHAREDFIPHVVQSSSTHICGLQLLHVAAPVVYNSIAKLTSAMLMIIRSGIVSCSIHT